MQRLNNSNNFNSHSRIYNVSEISVEDGNYEFAEFDCRSNRNSDDESHAGTKHSQPNNGSNGATKSLTSTKADIMDIDFDTVSSTTTSTGISSLVSSGQQHGNDKKNKFVNAAVVLDDLPGPATSTAGDVKRNQ